MRWKSKSDKPYGQIFAIMELYPRNVRHMDKHELFSGLSHILESIHPESYIYTPPSFFSRRDLSLLCTGQCLSPNRIKKHKDAHDQECHAISAWAWLNDDTLTMYNGLAYLDDFGDWVQHTFTLDTQNNVIEPTPMLRDTYYGTPMTLLDTLKFVRNELQNIRNLDLKPNKLWNRRIERLCHYHGKYQKSLVNYLKLASEEIHSNYGKIIKNPTRAPLEKGMVVEYY